MDNDLIQSIQSVIDFDISKFDDAFFIKAVENRIAIVKVNGISEYIQHLSNNIDEANKLLQSLYITHTEFFRNPLTFAHLEEWILPLLMNRKSDKGELRIWSAGCSTGQEAYSIAMLIENLNSREQKKVRYRIIATDVSESALIKAKTGEYNEKDIQKIRVKDLNEFFVKFGETYKVSPQLKQHVSFSTYDLLDNLSSSPQESIFGNFDLIICSNVLFYYKLRYQRFIIKKLVGVMDEKGYLITGEAEKYNVEKSRYLNMVSTSSTIFQSKKEMHYET